MTFCPVEVRVERVMEINWWTQKVRKYKIKQKEVGGLKNAFHKQSNKSILITQRSTAKNLLILIFYNNWCYGQFITWQLHYLEIIVFVITYLQFKCFVFIGHRFIHLYYVQNDLQNAVCQCG